MYPVKGFTCRMLLGFIGESHDMDTTACLASRYVRHASTSLLRGSSGMELCYVKAERASSALLMGTAPASANAHAPNIMQQGSVRGKFATTHLIRHTLIGNVANTTIFRRVFDSRTGFSVF